MQGINTPTKAEAMLEGIANGLIRGHRPGQMSLFRELDRVLIARDAVATTRQESILTAPTHRPELATDFKGARGPSHGRYVKRPGS